MTTSTTITDDRIEKRTLLRVPRARVWRALTDLREFSAWFGGDLQGSFVPGGKVRGTGCCNGRPVELQVERMQPMDLFSYRWHVYAGDPAADLSSEPTTLVEFRLADAPGGTELVVVESGFGALGDDRRCEAFPKHEAGWIHQLANVERHVES